MKIPIVCGPTATGKTEFAVKLAQKNNGELISADSRQVYKYLDIGTNKGEISLQQSKYYSDLNTELPVHLIKRIPIHLLSFLEPDKKFSVFEFQKYANSLINDILSRNKTPIIVGGTGLYIDSLVKNYNLVEVSTNTKQLALRQKLESKNLNELQHLLSNKSPKIFEHLNNSDRNNPRRLIRLIEKIRFDSENSPEKKDSKYTFKLYYPTYDWATLKGRINDRVEEMFEKGLVAETKNILQRGFSSDSCALKTMGYKEVIDFLNESKNQEFVALNVCKQKVKTAHRQYARRQRTWFEGESRGYVFEYFYPSNSI